jgi:PiT family inorganic phosphate transporter
MELKSIEKIDNAVKFTRQDSVKLSLGLLFIITIMIFVSLSDQSNPTILIVAAMIGGYMAMNIGANDVANNVGPAVGSGAVTLIGAIIIAAIFEAAGALIAGGDVVGTIKKGIIDPSGIDAQTFVWLMMAALLSAAIWLNLATAIGAPVSTTHSIVGGVLGGGIAAAGWATVNWPTMGKIAASWVISPVLGGFIAAMVLLFIKKKIIYKSDVVAAAKKTVPLLIALMTAAFVTYLTLKGLKKVWPDIVDLLPFLPETKKPSFLVALSFGAIAGVISYIFMKENVAKKAAGLENNRESINSLFTVPLIFAAALLSFAHGANDVANAVGPLAAISDALSTGVLNEEGKVGIPLWVMLIGAVGISIGLALYGPKLIRTVGSEITELDRMRAFAIAMAAAVTVIIASQLALPVSSTHIAVGGVFGVGLLREYLNHKDIQDEDAARLATMIEQHEGVETFIVRFNKAPIAEKEQMLKSVKNKDSKVAKKFELSKRERKMLKKLFKEQLVKRSALKKIIAAWIITVPAAATMSAAIFFMIRGYLLP